MLLDATSLALRDYHKAKRLLWNPQDLDFSADQVDWARMTDRERALIRRTLGLFLGGEESVTHDLAPLMIALRREGNHLEDEMFLTSQLFEEAKHVEFFVMVLDAIGETALDRTAIAGENYRALFGALETALDALLLDGGRPTQARAVASYHMVIEGVLAETGYYGIFQALRTRNLMPGLTRGLEYIQRDEARHIAFGLDLLTRIVRAEPGLRAIIDDQLEALLPLAQGVFIEVLGDFMPDIPFGLDLGTLLEYTGKQYMARLGVLDRAGRGEPALIEQSI